MVERIVETYYSIIYRITPECPSCNVDFNGETEHIDVFTDMDGQEHHIVDCHGCETRLELIIGREDPMYVTIRVTPVVEEFL